MGQSTGQLLFCMHRSRLQKSRRERVEGCKAYVGQPRQNFENEVWNIKNLTGKKNQKTKELNVKFIK